MRISCACLLRRRIRADLCGVTFVQIIFCLKVSSSKIVMNLNINNLIVMELRTKILKKCSESCQVILFSSHHTLYTQISMQAPQAPAPHFKIVQTKEPGSPKPLLALIPCGWEKNGVLWWPSNGTNRQEIAKMMKNPACLPQVGWLEVATKVKRTGIETYKNGQKMLKDMLDQSDSSTTDENDEQENNTLRRRNASLKTVNADADRSNFNAMMVRFA